MGVSKLKIARVTKGETQFSLGQKIGVSEKMVSFWETGRHRPSTDQCFLIAKKLETDVANIWPERFSGSLK